MGDFANRMVNGEALVGRRQGHLSASQKLFGVQPQHFGMQNYCTLIGEEKWEALLGFGALKVPRC